MCILILLIMDHTLRVLFFMAGEFPVRSVSLFLQFHILHFKRMNHKIHSPVQMSCYICSYENCLVERTKQRHQMLPINIAWLRIIFVRWKQRIIIVREKKGYVEW
jgi:hypothetical protein